MVKFWKYSLSLLLLLGTFGACEDDYSNLSKEERKAASYEVFKGGEHLRQGSPESMTRIAKAIAIDPDNCDAVRELSVAHLKRGMPLDWHPQFQKAVDCNPVIWKPWRGYLYLQFYRDYDRAIADFDASDVLTPDFVDAPQGHSVNYWRGIAYLGKKDLINSIKYFDTYINKEIEESGEDWVELTAFMYRGIAHFLNNDYEKALQDFDKQLHYGRNLSSDAKYYKATIFLRQNRCEEAKELVTSAITDFNNGYFHNRPYTEALLQIYFQDLETLVREIEVACRSNPS